MISDFTSSQERREEIRLAVRAYLADRPAIAPRLAAIARGIFPDTGTSEAEVEAALQFLIGLGQVEAVTAALGASKGYRITSAGTLAHERGE